MICNKCGKLLKDNSIFCDGCGARLEIRNESGQISQGYNNMQNQMPYYTNAYTQTPYPANAYGQAEYPVKRKFSALAIIGFVTSIFSLALNVWFVGLGTTALSLVGLLKCNKTNEKGRGLAIAGICIGGISTLFSIAMS